MVIDEKSAREFLGLTEGNLSEVSVKEAYRKVMKCVHPDSGGTTGLAALVTESRDMLLGILRDKAEFQSQSKSQPRPQTRVNQKIDLGTLYGVYPDLPGYIEEYSPKQIEANFVIKIRPLLPGKHFQVLATVNMPFDAFLEQRKAMFEARIVLPSTLRKHRFFYVETSIRRIEFSALGSPNRPWVACYRNPRFNTILKVVLA